MAKGTLTFTERSRADGVVPHATESSQCPEFHITNLIQDQKNEAHRSLVTSLRLHPRAWIQGQIFLTPKALDGLPHSSSVIGEVGLRLPSVLVILTSMRVMGGTLGRTMMQGRGQRVGQVERSQKPSYKEKLGPERGKLKGQWSDQKGN